MNSLTAILQSIFKMYFMAILVLFCSVLLALKFYNSQTMLCSNGESHSHIAKVNSNLLDSNDYSVELNDRSVLRVFP